MYMETLKLVAGLGERRPTVVLPFRLDQLFADLAVTDCQAGEVEDEIWRLWMHHPHRRAAVVLDRASSDIAAQASTSRKRAWRACCAHVRIFPRLGTSEPPSTTFKHVTKKACTISIAHWSWSRATSVHFAGWARSA